MSRPTISLSGVAARPRAVYLATPGGTRARGGIGRMIDYFSRSWREADLPLVVVDTYGPGPRALMPLYFASAVARIAADGASGRIGLLHIHMSERLSVLRKGALLYLAQALGIPVVLHLHGADFADYCRALPPSGRRRVERLLGRAEAVVVLGEHWRRFVRDELQVDDRRIVVLPNAVPGPAAVPARDEPGPCRILFLGELGERKGVPVLLAALASPALAEHDWHVTFAGGGAVEPSRAEAQRLGIGGRVSFLGWSDQATVARLLAGSEVLVLPSRNEGLAMAILEAMAHGLAVVATPVGATAEAVVDGETGLLVPVGDAPALAAALARLIGDRPLRRRLASAARRRYLERFEISAFNRKLSSLYRSVAAGAPPART